MVNSLDLWVKDPLVQTLSALLISCVIMVKNTNLSEPGRLHLSYRPSTCPTPVGGLGLAWWWLEQGRATQNSKLLQLLISLAGTHKASREGALSSLPARLSSHGTLVPGRRYEGMGVGGGGGGTQTSGMCLTHTLEVICLRITLFFVLFEKCQT